MSTLITWVCLLLFSANATFPESSPSAHNSLSANPSLANGQPNSREAYSVGLLIDRDPQLGTASFIQSQTGFLTDPLRPAQNPDAPSQTSHVIPKHLTDYLEQHRDALGHGAEALAGTALHTEYRTARNGLHTLIYHQEILGLQVFGARLLAHETYASELVNLSDTLLPALAQSAPKQLPEPDQPGLISAVHALLLAAKNAGDELAEECTIVPATDTAGVSRQQMLRAPFLLDAAQVRLVWLPRTATTMRLCWEVIFTSKASREMFRCWVDAETGENLKRQNLTSHLTPATYRVYTGRSPTPMMPGWNMPTNTQPDEVARSLVTLVALSTNASPEGWIPDGIYETKGNNVEARTDWDDSNDTNTLCVLNTNLLFDFPLSLSDHPTNYAEAATVNMFYWCNWTHDQLYELGFTEATGNFQRQNFDRGGLAGDPVMADAQDGANDLAHHQNVTSFSTPPDGLPPRLTLNLFTASNPYRDSSLDADTIIHEYCHGLSTRLVGGGLGLEGIQAQGLGEGWSDFYALALLSRAEESLDGNFPVAAYTGMNLYGMTNNYYFGQRRYPYSTNLNVNPLTFKDMDPRQASNHSGIPRNDTLTSQADDIHNVGEIWCATLWDLRANLIQKYGFTNGNHLALQLVTDGLRLAPPSPNFLQARDAIIQAERVLTGGTNRTELWRAFARRGMGLHAQSPAALTAGGVREDFTMGDDLRISPSTDMLVTGPAGGPFKILSSHYQLINDGVTNLSWVAQWGNLLQPSYTSGTLSPGDPATLVTVIPSAYTLVLAEGKCTNSITFSNVSTGVIQSRNVIFELGQPAVLTEQFANEAFDLGNLTLLFTPDLSGLGYQVYRAPATAFPTDPSGGTVAPLANDTYYPITLTNDASVAVYLCRTPQLYLCSDGHITLQPNGNTNVFSSSLEEYFGSPRAAAFYADLDPSQGGSVSYLQLEDRFAATWLEVPEHNRTNKNSFQIELFYDGRIRMTWLSMAGRNALVGLTRGTGVPLGFVNGDLNAVEILPSALLTLSLPPNLREGDGILTNQASVTLPQPVSSNVTVSFYSSTPSKLLAPSNVVIEAGTTNATFSIEVVDNADLDGPLTVRLEALVPGLAMGRTLVTVEDNESTNLALTLPTQIRENDGVLTNGGRVGISGPLTTNVFISITSGDTNQIQVATNVLLSAGQTNAWFTFTVVDDTILDGPQPASIAASATGFGTAVASFLVLDNEFPGVLTNLFRGPTEWGFSWPVFADGFVLESAPRLQSNAWSTVTNLSLTTNGNWLVITLPILPTNQFFRLRKPQ